MLDVLKDLHADLISAGYEIADITIPRNRRTMVVRETSGLLTELSVLHHFVRAEYVKLYAAQRGTTWLERAQRRAGMSISRTLEDLRALVANYPDRERVIVAAEEWQEFRALVGPESLIPATRSLPPLFWFLDKQIVTPQYEINRRRLEAGVREVPPIVVFSSSDLVGDQRQYLEARGYAVIVSHKQERVGVLGAAALEDVAP